MNETPLFYMSWRFFKVFVVKGLLHELVMSSCTGSQKPTMTPKQRKKVWVIDQVWGQDGWILAKFFFCVFMDRDEVEVNKLAKKERGQYSAILTEQTWSIKDLLYGFWWNFACGIQRVVPSGQDGSILPARVANHSARFGSSCPLAELAI